MTSLLRLAALTAVVLPSTLAAQSGERFDMARFNTGGSDIFKTFHVSETRPLREALAADTISEDTSVLVTETAAGSLALVTDQMAFHHIAQGSADGREWMATF